MLNVVHLPAKEREMFRDPKVFKLRFRTNYLMKELARLQSVDEL